LAKYGKCKEGQEEAFPEQGQAVVKETQALQETRSEQNQENRDDQRTAMSTWQQRRNFFTIDNVESVAP
jgi:hypothetical protein